MSTLIHFCCVVLLLPCLIIKASCSSDSRFGIVEPFPENIYPLEFTSAQVTCAAYDSAGVKVPQKILFMRRDMFNNYVELNPNDNLYFENRTEIVDNKKKVFSTMHFRNVTKEDDSLDGALGSYECHAYAVGDVNPRARHGFSVNVISRNEIPRVVVPGNKLLQHGDNVTLTCNLTSRGSNIAATPLKRISWFKDGVLMDSLRNPDSQDPEYMLGPLQIKDASVRDGGMYTCLLEVLLRNVWKYSVKDSTVIQIAPWFEQKGEQNVTGKTGESVRLECSAKGFPLTVEWKFKSSETVESCIGYSTNKRYNITRKGIYDPYYLTVSDLLMNDTGSYYCCLPSNCSVNIADDRCQRFVLAVENEGTGDQNGTGDKNGTWDQNDDKNPQAGTMTLTSHRVFVMMVFFVVSSLIL